MDTQLRYRGREVGAAEITHVRKLIVEQPELSRRALSIRLCHDWNWKQPNGVPRDMVCRGLLLALHRAQHIELPAPRHSNLYPRRKPEPTVIDREPLALPLKALGPIELQQVRRRPEERLVNSLIAEHHYLGYTQPVGEHLKYLVVASGRPIACFAWSSAPRHLGARDRYIGWPSDARRRNIRFIAYNTRFLILPWVRVPHLASHLLGRMARQLSADWQHVYNHPIYFLETFVDFARYRGTCYRAANWTSLGFTTGRGKADQTKRPNRSIKEVLGLALEPNFRDLLNVESEVK